MTLVRRLFVVTTALYWVVLFVMTHLPPKRVPHGPGGDKLHHFGAYLVLTFLLGGTLWMVFPARRRLMPLLVVLAAMAYGAFDEVTQIAVGRACELNDWFADVAGAASAGAALYLLQIYFLRRGRSAAASAASAAEDRALAVESA